MSHPIGSVVAVLAGALALSGCATSVAPVDVTRFHAGESAVATGGIMIEPQPGPPVDDLEYRTYAAAVSQELQRIGFVDEAGRQTAAPSQYVALIAYDRVVQSPYAASGSPVSVGVGGATGGYGSGLGVGIGINLSGKPKSVVRSYLSVQIRRRADHVAIWEGRAETSAKAGTPAAQPGIAAGKLANALFKGYPGKSGETITVK